MFVDLLLDNFRADFPTADSEADIQSLIEKTEKEGDQIEETSQNQSSAFSFAKVWAADKDALTDMNEGASEHADETDDSWAQVLAKLETERTKTQAQEVTGRGAKRKAAPSFLPQVCTSFLTALIAGLQASQQNLNIVFGSDGSSPENSPEKPKKKKGKKKLLDREDYNASVHSSDAESEVGTDASSAALDDLLVGVVKKAKRGLTSAIVHDYADRLHENYCGLCGSTHVGTCHMVQNPENLVEYRALLMSEATNKESIEIRVSCLTAGLSMSVLTSFPARSNPSNRRKTLEDGKA